MDAAEQSRQRQRIERARETVGSYRSAVNALEEALRKSPNNARLLTSLGHNWFNVQEYERACAAFEKALAIDPGFLRASIGLSESCLQLGEVAHAARILEALFSSGNRTFPVCRLLSQLPGSLVTVDLLPALVALEGANVSDRPGYEAALGFVKAAVLHNAGRYSETWEALVAANSHKRGLLREKCATEAESNARDVERLRRERDKVPDVHDVENVPQSLFIFGPSRCGKSSVEQLTTVLGGVNRGFEKGIINNVLRVFRTAKVLTGPRVSALTPMMHDAFRELYLKELCERAPGASVFTNTMPELAVDAVHLAEIVPNARFIFVKRDIDDLAIRIFMKDYETDSNPYAYSIDTIYDHIRWYNELIDLLAKRLPDISRIVRYEQVVEDPAAVVDIAASLCGVPACDWQQPEPPGDDRGCAKPYREFVKASLADC